MPFLFELPLGLDAEKASAQVKPTFRRWNMGSWLEEYAKYLKEGRSSKTVEAYLCDLRQFGAWFERVNAEELRPERVTGVDCHDFRRDQLEREQVAPSTWNRRRASLVVFTQWAIVQGYLKNDPMDSVDEKEVVELPPRWLDEGEYRRLVRDFDQQVNAASTVYQERTSLMYRSIGALMLYAGLRVEEVCSLDPGDLEISDRKGRVIVRDGKGGKHREIPLSKKARRALSAWLEWREKHHSEQVPLFFGKKMEALGQRAVQMYFQDVRRVLEIEDLTPHALRHTFVKRLVDARHPINWIQKLAGHSDIRTTFRYAQAGWADYEELVESL